MSIKSPSDLDVLIGAKIRAARIAKGMSQEKLGEHIGLTFQQIQKYERGKNRISAGRLDQMAQVLDCPLLWLFGKTDDSGIVPTAHQLLADRIADLRPDQRRSIEKVIDAMSEALPQAAE